MVFNATFNNISTIYLGGQFYRWRNRSARRKRPTCVLYKLELSPVECAIFKMVCPPMYKINTLNHNNHILEYYFVKIFKNYSFHNYYYFANI